MGAVVKVSSRAVVVPVSDFVHGVLVDGSIVGEDGTKNAVMGEMGRVSGTGIGEELGDGRVGDGAVTGSGLAEGALRDVESWVERGLVVEEDVVGARDVR